mgnify:FL=1
MIATFNATPDDFAGFVHRMDARREKLVQGCLRRDRLDFAGHAGAKCLLFKAPRGFGKSVQIALCAQAAIDRKEDCVYLDLSSIWQEDVDEAEFIANMIVAVLAPQEVASMPSGRSLKNTALDLLLAREKPVTVCLDGVTDVFAIQKFLKAITLETPETVRLAVSERQPGSMVTLSVLPDVVTIGPSELSFTLDEARSVLPMEAENSGLF